MILIGLFSTHLTYLLLAVIYIFGYGAYALNCKQKQCENDAGQAKQIAFEAAKSEASYLQQKDCFYWEDSCNSDVVASVGDEIVKYDYDIFKSIKPREYFCSLLCDRRITGCISTRPPPFFV